MLQKVLGFEIPRHRLLQSVVSKNVRRSIALTLASGSTQYTVTYTNTPSEKWQITNAHNGTINLEAKFTPSHFFNAIAHPSLPLSEFFITEQSAFRNLASFDQFIQATSTTYTSMTKYITTLGTLDASYRRDFVAISKKLEKFPSTDQLHTQIEDAVHAKDRMLLDLTNLETNRITLQQEMTHTDYEMKEVQQLTLDIEMQRDQIQTFQALADTKTRNIAECEAQLKSYENMKDIQVCARKTEVKLEVELKELDEQIEKMAKEQGRIESTLTIAQSDEKRFSIEIATLETTIPKEKLGIVATGIDPQELFKDQKIQARIESLQNEIAIALKSYNLYYGELGILHKAQELLKSHPDMSTCPCCGTPLGVEIADIFASHVVDRKKMLQKTDALKGTQQAIIKKLREYGDISRRITLKEEKKKVLQAKYAELTQQITEWITQLNANIQARDQLTLKRTTILDILKTEQQIDAEKLHIKIETAKVDLGDLREKITERKDGVDRICQKVTELRDQPTLQKKLITLAVQQDVLDTEVLKKKTEQIEVEYHIKELRTEEREVQKLDTMRALSSEKHHVCRSYLNQFVKLLWNYEQSLKDELIELGNEHLFVGSVNKEKGEIIREIQDHQFNQNLIALSTGEQVVVSTKVKAKNGIWQHGGFAVIDADLSTDAMQDCMQTLSQHGCEQVIFLKVSDGELEAVPLPRGDLFR